MVDPTRLVTPLDDFESAFFGLNFRNRRSIQTHGEPIVLVDPIYVADVYNSTDESASFLQSNGLFFMDFGGDVSSPVWWKSPYVFIPIFTQGTLADLVAPADVTVLAENVGCDSGSFLFLPLSPQIPASLDEMLKDAIDNSDAVVLPLPAGLWRAYYQQFDAPKNNEVGLYRDIVLKHAVAME